MRLIALKRKSLLNIKNTLCYVWLLKEFYVSLRRDK